MNDDVQKLSQALESRQDSLVTFETVYASLINATALIGNALVCFVVYKTPRLRTIPNMFVVALAISDILMSTVCMPLSAVTLARGEWIFGAKLCSFHGFGVFTFGLVSLHTMGLISISRYYRVVRQNAFATHFTKRKTLRFTAATWCLGLIGSVPPFFFEPSGFQFQPGKAMCLYTFDTNIAYTLFIETAYVATPLVLITVCYTRVFREVSRTNKVFSQQNNVQRLRSNIEEAKITKTLVSVMVGYSFCWLPISVVDILDASRGRPTLPREVYLMYGCLVYLSSTINPFIYGVTNKTFRRAYVQVARRLLCLKSERSYANDSVAAAAAGNNQRSSTRRRAFTTNGSSEQKQT